MYFVIGARKASSQRRSAPLRVHVMPENIRSRGQSEPAPSGAQRRSQLRMSAVQEVFQALFHPLHAPAYTFRHASLSVPVLRKTLPPEVGHEEAHLHSHR